MHRQTNWNDGIAQFIKLKAQHPQTIEDLVNNEEEYQRQWITSKKIQRQRKDYEQARGNQELQLNLLKKAIARKQVLIKEISSLNIQLQFLQLQAEKHGWEGQTPGHRISNNSERSSSSQSHEAQLKDIQRKIQTLHQQFEEKKQELMKEVDALVELRIQLKEDTTKVEAGILQLKQQQVYKCEEEELRHKIKEVKLVNQQMFAKNKQLKEQHKFCLSQYEKPLTKLHNECDMIDNSRKKMNGVVRQMKKQLLSGQTRFSKKFIQLKQKCSQYRGDISELLQEFHKHIQKHPEVHFIEIKKDGSLQHYGEELGDYELLLKEALKGARQTPQEYLDADRALEGVTEYMNQILARQKQMENETHLLRQAVERKSREIESERGRLKGKH